MDGYNIYFHCTTASIKFKEEILTDFHKVLVNFFRFALFWPKNVEATEIWDRTRILNYLVRLNLLEDNQVDRG